ncbi:hypothetical protein NQZ68_026317 [Dissostichus eleginoides]|nr:hypothetical protein NQZ68_026317 [Dissostichus eleginoides]
MAAVQPAPSLSTTEDPAVLQLQYPVTGPGWPNEGDPAGHPLPPSNMDEPEVIQRRLFAKQRRLFTIQWQRSSPRRSTDIQNRTYLGENESSPRY